MAVVGHRVGGIGRPLCSEHHIGSAHGVGGACGIRGRAVRPPTEGVSSFREQTPRADGERRGLADIALCRNVSGPTVGAIGHAVERSRAHRETDSGCVRGPKARVSGRVSEGVWTRVAVGWRIIEGAICVQGHGAVRRVTRLGGSQTVTGIIGEHALGRVDVQRNVGGRSIGVICRDRVLKRAR